MNIIKTIKISKVTALSALAIVFGAVAFTAPQAFASTSYYGGEPSYYGGGSHDCGCSTGSGDNHGGSYYGGSTYTNYHPTSNPSSASSASSASASASNGNTTVTVSNPVTVNVPVTVIGGGSGYATTPLYAPSPIAYGNSYPSYVPTYYSNTYAQLGGSCYAQTTSASVGQNVLWVVNAYGGNQNNYTYSWSGTDGLYGYGVTMSYAYNTPGTMVANVSISSGGQSVTIPCNNSVIVNGYNYSYYNPAPVTTTYIQPNNGQYNNQYLGSGLTVGCAADVSTVHVGTPVTWSVEATGGSGSYTYAWTGTNGLAGSQSSVATAYETTGTKQATVIVTSSNGQTTSKSCTPVTVVGNGNGNGGATVTPAPTNTNNSGLSAASLFSLGNIPWGWVAVLIIIVLFGTVIYLLTNKNKI